MLAKFAEDERIEQMNAQRRRMKMLEHKREVERLIEERRQMYEEEKEVMYSGGSRAEVKNDVAGGAGGAERRGEKSPGPAGAHRTRASAHLAGSSREARAGVHAERRTGVQRRSRDVQSGSACQQVQMRRMTGEPLAGIPLHLYSFTSTHDTFLAVRLPVVNIW
mmetsp:Transcript_41554/g.130983  ORF Transcript_41554/g.130983 Transcript_41554/m.130983 type:complete len:164 (+) Transcript_41554:352-843(+)